MSALMRPRGNRFYLHRGIKIIFAIHPILIPLRIPQLV
jgi:hypothetical protein